MTIVEQIHRQRDKQISRLRKADTLVLSRLAQVYLKGELRLWETSEQTARQDLTEFLGMKVVLLDNDVEVVVHVG